MLAGNLLGLPTPLKEIDLLCMNAMNVFKQYLNQFIFSTIQKPGTQLDHFCCIIFLAQREDDQLLLNAACICAPIHQKTTNLVFERGADAGILWYNVWIVLLMELFVGGAKVNTKVSF